MKLKGVNPLEQHVEKIVLAAVSVVFLGVLAMQFLVEPNKVKVGTAQPVRPGEAFRPVEAKAKEIQAVMTQQDLADKLPQAPKYDLVNQLRNVRENPLVAPRAFALGPTLALEGSDLKTQGVEVDKISPVTIPAPGHVVAAAFRATLDPTEPENTPELKPFVPAEQPLDTRAVSVACQFDGTALKAALSAAPEDSGVKAIPPSWWRDSMEILAVRLERQEQKADGGWSDPVEVPAPPGRPTMAERLKSVKSTQELLDAVTEARAEAEDIQRPPFYRTIAPAQGWSPPVEGAAGGMEVQTKNPEVDRLVNKIATANKQLDTVKKSREETANAPVKAPTPRGGGEGGGGGGKGAGGGGQIAPNPQSGPSMTQQEKDGKLRTFDKRIKDLEAQIAKDTDALKVLGKDAAGKPLTATPAAEPGQPLPVAKPLLDDDQVKLWSHDMTVEPGKTYRYRVKVGLNNPAFARTSALLPEQHDLASSALAYSQASEWSEPVQVLPDQFYFLTSATEADALGPPRATAEVFKFFYGYYRKASVSLEPGDSISATIRLPDPNKLPIYDLKPAATSATPPAPGVPQPQQEPAPAGGKGGKLGRDEGRGQPKVPGAPTEKAQVTLPANAKPYPKPTIPAAVDAMLIDVARVISGGEGGPRAEAYLRDANGQVIVAVPEDQRRLPAYQMAAASAKEGESQGQPAAPSTEPGKDPNKPPTPPKTPQPPRIPTPGGGGGGAGGG